MYPSSFSDVRFSLIQQNKRPFPITAKTRDLLKNNRPVPDGLYSARQGTTANEYNCETCFNNKKNCLGHPAIIDPPTPPMNPTTSTALKTWIKIICVGCGNPLISANELLKFPVKERVERILKVVKSKTVNTRTCPSCNLEFPKLQKEMDEQNIFKITSGKEPKLLMPSDLLTIFNRVHASTVELMGYPPKSHPINYIIKYIIVTPPSARPEVIKIGSTVKSSIDEHTSHYQLLVDKKVDLLTTNVDKQNANVLAYNNIYASALKGKEKSSIAGQLPSKGGLFRNNMMGKRVAGSARGVISNNTDMMIDELSVPYHTAKTIQYYDHVQEYNRDILMSYVRNGPNGYPGASSVIHNGITYSVTDKSNIVLEIGDIVYRDIVDGDPTPFCRQPSLMISNISGMRSKVMMNPRNNNYGINSIICPYFNADFDGDEMNQFVCSSLIGRNEIQKLSAVSNWFISNASSTPLIGQMEDSILGLAALTRKDVRLDHYHAAKLFQKTTFVPDLTNMPPVLTGYDIISILLKDTPINFSKNSQWNTAAYKQWIEFDPADERVVITKGIMERGVLDKASVGKGIAGGINDIINSEYGTAKTLEIIYNMQQVAIAFESQRCMSIGFVDMLLPRETRDEINRLSMDLVNKANEITDRLESGNIIPPIGKTVDQFYEDLQIAALTDPDLYVGAILSAIDINTNGGWLMTGLGSKGKFADLTSMIGNVGLRNINGKRIAQNFSYARTMPYFPRFATDPSARGYVENAYVCGIKKTEYCFAASQVRFDLIVKALSTSVTGDQNRQSIKNLESIITNNFRWATKHDNIIQFVYGDDYLDPRKLIKVKLPTVKISDKELKEKYFHADFKKYNEKLVEDRDVYREAFLKIETVNVCELISDERKMPVDIERVLRTVIDEYGHLVKQRKTSSSGLADLVKMVEHFIEDVPYVMLNSTQRKNKFPVPKFIEASVFLFRMLCRIALRPNILEKLINDGTINATVLGILLDKIFLIYLEALISPGTAVGNIAAQSFSEPLTQYMLDAHRRSSSGGTSKSTMNVLKEVIGARSVDKLSAPSMILPVIAKYNTNKEHVQRIADRIELITLSRFVVSHHLFLERFGEPVHSKFAHEKKFIAEFVKQNPLMKPPVDLVKRCLRIVLSKSTLILKNVSTELIVRKLYENFTNIYIAYTQENTNSIVLRIYFRSILFKELASIIELRKLRENILDSVIRGVRGIRSAEAVKLLRSQVNQDGSISQNENCWGIKTLGTNLAEMLSFPDIDHAGIQTSAIKEVEAICGIAAARQRIAVELKNLGIECGMRHLLIYADEMVNTGTVTSIERSGVKAREPKNILLRMGYSSPIATLEEAAINNTTDKLSGITSAFLVGTVPQLGTKYNQVYVNEDFVRENSKSAESMLSSLL